MEFASEKIWQNHLLRGGKFLDVRAPVEFAAGSIPQSLNLPILNDEERHLVGTCYKQQGPEAAVELGHTLVSGSVREAKIQAWTEAVKQFPDILLYCFRGGQRSLIAQAWIRESGLEVSRIPGGYKVMRQYLISGLTKATEQLSFITLGGHTGSGKTLTLRKFMKSNPDAVIDLEALGRHRGSAFGEELDPQPSQVDFENQLAVTIMRAQLTRPLLWMEDEARAIGKVTLPDSVFTRLRTGPLVLIEESRERRAEIIFQEYVIDQFAELKRRSNEDAAWAALGTRLKTPVMRISNKLGGERTKVALEMVESALNASRGTDTWERHLAWIMYLLEHYYDPYYQRHAERQANRVIFRGTRDEVSEYFYSTS